MNASTSWRSEAWCDAKDTKRCATNMMDWKWTRGSALQGLDWTAPWRDSSENKLDHVVRATSGRVVGSAGDGTGRDGHGNYGEGLFDEQRYEHDEVEDGPVSNYNSQKWINLRGEKEWEKSATQVYDEQQAKKGGDGDGEGDGEAVDPEGRRVRFQRSESQGLFYDNAGRPLDSMAGEDYERRDLAMDARAQVMRDERMSE